MYELNMVDNIPREACFKTFTVKELHPTFAAEIQGVDFADLSDQTFAEIMAAMAKYGVCVFRNTGLDDDSHVAFSRRLGDLDNIKKYMVGGRKLRYKYYELFDAGNVDEDETVLDLDDPRAHFAKGNTLFHVDSSFNPRRASFSLLRAVHIPPAGHGGNTDFADSRTAFDELPPALSCELLENDYIGAHTIAQSRKLGSPVFFSDLDPAQEKMARHRILQRHEPSRRMALYIASHCHHLEDGSSGMPLTLEKSQTLLETLTGHVTQQKYVTSIPWQAPGDMIIWDNRCVLHRATGGAFEGRYLRDLRRTTVHDDSPTAWGLNRVEENLDEWMSTVMDPAAGKMRSVEVH